MGPPATKAGETGGGASPTGPLTGDIEVTRLPRGGLAPVLDKAQAAWRFVVQKAREVWRFVLEKARVQLPRIQAKVRKVMPHIDTLVANDTRPRWFLPAVAVAGLAVGIGLVAIIVSAVRGGGDTERDTTAGRSSANPSSSPADPSPTAPAAAPAPTGAGPAVSLAPCTVTGPAHVVAPNATVAAGVEVVRLGDDLALGFAPTDHEAIGVRIDPGTLSASATARARSRDPVRRVTPLASAHGGLMIVVDADRKNDRLQGRRSVLGDPPVQLGASDGNISWARVGGAPAGKLWPIDEGGNVESLRGATTGGGERTLAIAYRRGSTVWMGVATGSSTLAAKGDLSHVDGLGTAIGSPAVAVADGVVLVAWADRPSSDEPWRLRWVRFDAGGAPTATQTFTPPAGGRGEQAMSPAITALPGSRFLLVWTEGPMSGHDVRALTLSSDGKPLGQPLVISNAGVNAGQGQAAVTTSGRGVVAFLESNGTGFQIGATPISCAE
jgi:hypothetical protein